MPRSGHLNTMEAMSRLRPQVLEYAQPRAKVKLFIFAKPTEEVHLPSNAMTCLWLTLAQFVSWIPAASIVFASDGSTSITDVQTSTIARTMLIIYTVLGASSILAGVRTLLRPRHDEERPGLVICLAMSSIIIGILCIWIFYMIAQGVNGGQG